MLIMEQKCKMVMESLEASVVSAWWEYDSEKMQQCSLIII